MVATHQRSTDRGHTWRAGSPVASPMHLAAIQPSILFHRDGRLEAVARTRHGVLAMIWSHNGGVNWTSLAAIDPPNPNAGTDAVTLRDGRQFIVHNHAAHGAETPGDGPRWPLNVALSGDGVHWRPVLTLESARLPDGCACRRDTVIVS